MSQFPVSEYKLCLTTVDKESAARELAKALLQQKLVACVNIHSRVTSLYHWQGEIAEDQEYLLLLKTHSQKINALRDTLLRLHPYDVPEFIVLDIQQGSTEYLRWIDESLK